MGRKSCKVDFDDRLKAARDGAGRHPRLDRLAASLDGRSERPSADSEEPGPWTALNDAYQRRFGISPAEATSPPRS